ncbi:MAG TPA: serine/threonine-protein kinase, partial [Candidatus Limnocylindria bacterium]
MTLQPGTSLGNYEILEKIGAGGMGAVYKAYQPGLGRFVAIKVLPPQTAGDPAFGERFAQEARAVGKLRHPNIVTAFDFTQHGDIAYLVSDYIDGGTLADQLGTPLPLDYALGILGPIAAALDYAHARGIVHRDIKPQNVLLTREGTAVLTDFGLAKIVGPGSGMTQAGSLMGTADYMAPELAGGAEAAGPAADQYALGIIAFQMLVGRHPFPSDNPLSALMAHVNKPVPLPSQLGVVLPPGAEAALLRALAKKPEDRFARSGDFVRALAGSQYTVPAPAAAFSAPSISPSQPPIVPTTPPVSVASPFVSPSDLISPVAPVVPPRPATEPTLVATAVAGGAAGATAAVLSPPKERGSFPWRRAIVPAVLVLVLA